MINEDIDSIQYSDIERLEQDKVPEGDTLDYKRDMIKDADLLKQICAFANTRGGDIIFGIKESGDGGPPEEIIGLKDSTKKETIEQLVLSNIVPRLEVKIRLVESTHDEKKSILIIRIPDSSLKPHFYSKSEKYYKRYQFESRAMTEQEVCDRYKQRFTNYDKLEQYITDNTPRKAFPPDEVVLNIIVIPSNIERRLIDTSNLEELKWIENIKMTYKTSCCPESLLPMKFFGKGIKFEAWKNCEPLIEIHRNGCIVYRQYMEPINDKLFNVNKVLVGLLNMLEFASKILPHYGYFGEVRISVYVDSNSKLRLYTGEGYSGKQETYEIHSTIDREHPLQFVTDSSEFITNSIMNDIFNHFDEPRNWFFKNGKLDRDQLHRRGIRCD